MQKLQPIFEKVSTGTANHEKSQPLTENAATLDEKSFNQTIEKALTSCYSNKKSYNHLYKTFNCRWKEDACFFCWNQCNDNFQPENRFAGIDDFDAATRGLFTRARRWQLFENFCRDRLSLS